MRILLAIMIITLTACGASRATTQDPEPEVAKKTEHESLVQRRCELPVIGSWSTFQGDARRNGVSAARAIQKPTIRWKINIGTQGWLNNPVIVGDLAFVGSNGSIWNKPDATDGVYAVRVSDGEVVWFAPATNDVNGVAYADCVVVATSDDGIVRGLDAMTGDVIWQHITGADRKVYSNPLIVGRYAIVGDSMGRLQTYDLATGEDLWSRTIGGAIRGGASSDGTRVFVGAENGALKAFNLADGEEIWTASVEPWGIYGAPTVVGDRVIVGVVRDTTYGRPAIWAYENETGRLAWKSINSKGFQGGWGNVRSSVAIWRDLAIWGEPYSNRIVAASLEDGEVVWSSANGPCMFPHWSSPAIVGDLAIVGRHDGGLYALHVEDGTRAWSVYLGDQTQAGLEFPQGFEESRWSRCEWDPTVGRPIFSSPAVADDGTILVGTGEGILYAIGEEEI